MASSENWLERWEIGRIGWHEPGGNQNLKSHWQGSGKRVLVPWCGKTPDLAWLEARGNDVVGVELSEIAAQAFFEEHELDYRQSGDALPVFTATDRRISIACGDYFELTPESLGGAFDACYDRGALVAADPPARQRYIDTTLGLLAPDAYYLLIAVEYDQSVAPGPPWSLDQHAVAALLPGLERVAVVDDLANCPPKFTDAGIKAFNELVYAGTLARPQSSG